MTRGLLSLLRCPICKDVMRTSVALRRCSHTFCSMCIRRYLNHHQSCPCCREEAFDSDLVCVRQLDAVITELRKESKLRSPPRPKSLRPSPSLQFSQSSNVAKLPAAKGITRFFPKSSPKRAPPPPIHPSPNPPPSNPCPPFPIGNIEHEACDLSQTPPPPPPPPPPHNHPTQPVNSLFTYSIPPPVQVASSSQRSATIPVPALLPNIVPVPPQPLNQLEDIKNLPYSGAKSVFVSSAAEVKGDFRVYGLEGLEVELDGKNSSRLAVPAGAKVAVMKRMRMKTPTYPALSNKQLRGIIKQAHLPLSNSRDQMIARHREFVVRYNAAIDASYGEDSNAEQVIKKVSREVLSLEQAQKPNYLLDMCKKQKTSKSTSTDPFRVLIRDYRRKHGRKKPRKRCTLSRPPSTTSTPTTKNEASSNSPSVHTTPNLTPKPPNLKHPSVVVPPTTTPFVPKPPVLLSHLPHFNCPSQTSTPDSESGGSRYDTVNSAIMSLARLKCSVCSKSTPANGRYCMYCGSRFPLSVIQANQKVVPAPSTAPENMVTVARKSILTSDQRQAILKKKELAKKRLKAHTARKRWGKIFRN